jgi:hypothetical protein
MTNFRIRLFLNRRTRSRRDRLNLRRRKWRDRVGTGLVFKPYWGKGCGRERHYICLGI